MKINYQCEKCGAAIATIEMPYLDESKLGFDCLTSDEREDIISMDYVEDTVHVKALCDSCIEKMDIEKEDQSMLIYTGKYIIH